MNFLVDYAGSSSSSDSDEDSELLHESQNDKTRDAPKLPKPAFGSESASLSNSVFSNPYAEEEKAKKNLLEKHVKMVTPPEKLIIINGKKICWMYRKGRCRFGQNCKYAHDSDLQKTSEELAEDKKKTNTVVCESQGTQSSSLPPTIANPESSSFNWDEESRKKLKRPGLSTGIVPGKKVLKMYYDQKNKEEMK